MTQIKSKVGVHMANSQLARRMMRLLILGVFILSSSLVAIAQDSDSEMGDPPEILTTEVDRLGEDFPEILDIDWVEYTDRDITLWLADSNEQFLVEDMIDLAKEGIDMIAPELAPYIELLSNNPDIVRFVAFDNASMDTDFVTGIVIVREQMLIDMPLLQISEMAVNFLPEAITVVEDPTGFELEGFDDVVSMQWSMDAIVTEVISMVYMLTDGDYMYSITFTSTPDNIEYDQAKAELILQTLVIDRTDEDA